MTMKSFFKDRRGNFAILTALVLPLAMFGTGAAIDYGLAVQTHQKLKSAADSAVLGAVSEAQMAYIAQEKVDLELLIKASAEELFKASIGALAFANVSSIQVSPKINKNEISASIDYDATYKTSLVSFVGYNTIPISNTARAVVNVRSYVNINFLIDVSASMGIGATPEDQKKVASAINCAFACHINEARGNSQYDKARAAGANMRIDVLRDAAISAVSTSKKASEFDDQVTFGVYKFSNELTTVVSGSDQRASDLQYLTTQIRDGILLDMTNGGTNIENSLQTLGKLLPKSGSGLRADDRIQYVIVLTDGVESGQAWTKAKNWFKHGSTKTNTPYKAYAAHEVNYALNDAVCKELVDKDIGTYFIYTEYLEPVFGEFSNHDKQRFGFVTNSLFPIIPKRFSDCTGDPHKVLKASTPDEIDKQFTQIVKGLSAPLRLY
ncbi:MAG: TadE/TadG family protein [Hoeflea sp.]|nr:TadE/TadG family protein [Hoeflea sp.]